MRSNGKPAIKVSEMRLGDVDVLPEGQFWFACQEPGCGAWHVCKRNLLLAHGRTNGKGRCPGSWQRIEPDITPEQWIRRRDNLIDPNTRRSTTVHKKTNPKTPAVMQMKVATYAQLQGARRVHRLYGCRRCESGQPCETGRYLHDRIQQLVQREAQRLTKASPTRA
ncbi:hypothetical protein [Streptomyces mayteni]